MHSIEYGRELDKIRMIACLAIILPLILLLLFFCIPDSFCLASLSRSRLLLIGFLFFYGVCTIILSMALLSTSPSHVKCAVRHAVKVSIDARVNVP